MESFQIPGWGGRVRKFVLLRVQSCVSVKAKNAELQLEGKRVTNHSARKTCISRLLDADILENFVAQSRKSLQGAGFYNLISNQQVINTKREGL